MIDVYIEDLITKGIDYYIDLNERFNIVIDNSKSNEEILDSDCEFE